MKTFARLQYVKIYVIGIKQDFMKQYFLAIFDNLCITQFFQVSNSIFFIIPPMMIYLFKQYSRQVCSSVNVVWILLIIVGMYFCKKQHSHVQNIVLLKNAVQQVFIISFFKTKIYVCVNQKFFLLFRFDFTKKL